MTTFTLRKTGIFLISFIVFTVTAHAQLNAAFIATPTSGCTPQVVNFTDQSTGNPTQWRWDLGNGTISFLRNPSTTYFIPGQYTIKLVVQRPGAIDSLIKTQYITIFAPPVVDFSAPVRSGCFPLPVQFTDMTTTSNGTLTQWQWDFGDGNFGNTQNPTHVYNTAGSFNVSLVVTNSNGCFKSITKPLYVQIASGVTAAFTNTAASSCTPPVNINFQNLSTGTGTLNYQWNFGDGTTSTQTAPAHNYSSPGSYTVQLIVTNASGCRDTLIRPNAVTIGAVSSGFNATDSVCTGTSVTFNNTSSPMPASVLWNFGDGTTSTLINPIKSYAVAGTYTVKLVNNFGACSDSVSRNIVVKPLASVSFFTTDTLSCSAPYTVSFTNTSTGAVTNQWFFGDGTTSNQVNPVHTYTTPGLYSVRLLCVNQYGCTTSIIKLQYIKIVPPQAVINALPQEGCSPFPWSFSSTITSTEPVSSYLWNFGDGTTSSAAAPTHTFTPGTYTISLIVTTPGGCRDTVTVPNGIRVGVKPIPDFTAAPRDVCAHIPVSFTDLSTGNVDQWLWDFGDGGSSTSQNPMHAYEDTGYFAVQLIVWNNGCPDTIRFENYVHINPPIAAFSVGSVCTDPLRRIFTDSSVGADDWFWDFGDGNTSTLQSPVHVYATAGTYIVNLTVRNFTTGCSYNTTSSVRLIDEAINFTANDTILCKNTTVTFTATGANTANISLYQWTFGDGTTGTGTTINHIYTVTGTYDVRLIMIDWNGCRDTMIRTQYITVNGPTADFGVPATTSCLQNIILFTDSSFSDGAHPITQWTWNYGDGTIQSYSAGPFQHNYLVAGIYSVTLTVTDNTGCRDSMVSPALLTISKPVANFNTTDTLTCPGRNITFNNTSTGNTLIYSWDFGDGTTSNSTNPVHVYTIDGVYSVKLVATDQYGCMDSVTKVSIVNIVTPTANFTVTDSIGTCPPLIVGFTNTSLNYSSYSWDFGDGNTSLNPNPSHFYDIPGTYYAVLTVTGPGGCIETKQQTIIVRGPYGSFTYDPLEGCSPMAINFIATTHDRVSFVWDFDDGITVPTNDSVISHMYTIPGAYLPKMILIDNAGCAVAITGADSIKVHGASAGLTFTPPINCTPATTQFNNTSTSDDAIVAYMWNFDDGGTSTSPNPSHIYTSAGFYYPSLLVTTSYGCTDSVKSLLPVKIVATPQGQISQTADGCTPVTINFAGTLAVADTSVITWQWTFGNGNTSSLATPPVQTYTTAGTYPVQLLVTNSTGCVDTVSASVQSYPLPAVQTVADITICQGTGKNLLVTGAATYTWWPSTGLSCTTCANPVATPAVVTNYVVTGTSAQGCVNKDSVIVAVKYPFSMSNSRGDTLCKGSSLQLFASGAYTYSWSPAAGLNSTTSATPSASPQVTTTYQVIGTDDLNCFRDTGYIPIRVFNIPTINAGEDKSINVGETVDLVPVISADVTSVIWSPTGSIFRSDYPSVTVKPRETTQYSVDVKNAGGCTARDNLTVYVICNGANVFIPNTFSPNADGANDIFYPRGRGLFSIKSAKVFNRWGEVMYQKNDFMPNDVSSGWDGTYKGKKLNSDVYVYIIEILCDNNSLLVYKGNIALVK